MKRIMVIGLAACLVLGFARASHAWSFGAEVKTTVNDVKKTNSENDNSMRSDRDMKIDNSTDTRNSNNRTDNSRRDSSNNSRTDNSRTDNSRRESAVGSYNTDSRKYDIDSHAVTDSYNTDRRSFDSHAVADSYNTTSVGNDYSVNKRVGSHDIGGSVRNSVMGDFNQKVGADFSGGFTGSVGGAFDASTVNTQTFGDVHVDASGESKE